jgi:hypothetical protein
VEFREIEIMFHVAPLIPYSPNDAQQVRLPPGEIVL